MAKLKTKTKVVYMKVGSILLGGLLIALSIYFAGQGGFSFGRNGDTATDGSGSAADCSGDTRLDEECFLKYAESLDLDADEFGECVAESKHDDVIDREISAGEGYGVQGTPSLYLGKGKGDEFQGFYVGGIGFSDIELIIEKLESSSVADAYAFWLDYLNESLAQLELQVRDHYTSADGGSLTGEELERAVAEVMDEQRTLIEEQFILKDFTVGNGVVEGNGEVVIMEFSDYECPYCQEFASSVLVQVKETFVESGRARFIFRDFPLEQIHPRARDAANAARCAGDQDKYFEYHNLLFEVN